MPSSTLTDSALATFPGRSTRTKNITCMACKTHKCPAHVYTDHTAPWYILEGSGMARKSVKESKKACLAFYNNKQKERKKKTKTTSKIMFTLARGSAFTLEGDPMNIAAYLAMQTPKTVSTPAAEFAGLGSNVLPAAGLLADVEGLEFDAWVVLEEKPDSKSTKLNINRHKATTMLTEDHETVLSCQDQTLEPFYLDSGTTVHISPNQSNFIKIDPISKKTDMWSGRQHYCSNWDRNHLDACG